MKAPGTTAPRLTRPRRRDVERLNKVHAVLPIGGKTRVVTFGELEEFPGRETIVMTQTIPDFKSLQEQVSPHLSGQERRTAKRTPGHLLDREPEAPAVRWRHGVHAAARRGRRQSTEPVARLRREADQARRHERCREAAGNFSTSCAPSSAAATKRTSIIC